MHAEYKVPGGKLVVVDLSVEGGRIEQAQLSGDFFLEPPEALSMMNKALAGLSIHSSAEEIAAHISRTLPQDIDMFGVTPQAIGIVVRRALA
ncbi:lipoate protein ligase C-terminal domain-containing protein [Alcaligenes sp. SDU_A2]|uniref:lipoate protein ligase C-terminal domain-containing protein n=1 Tax=Alcaligenes sp. SDU_A2 TaxID=3136634 RepID=UPI002BBAFBEA|nr:lipoate protein ligase C-terminal domain-containing protein [Alcaligenes sp.]HRL27106.1 lipoate protein ligase C-terminal domain-containing protein [Alcaligenes sp.]